MLVDAVPSSTLEDADRAVAAARKAQPGWNALTPMERGGYANDSDYGLSAYVFTRDNRTVMHCVKELSLGGIYFNRASGESPNGFHTGYRKSGLGGEGSSEDDQWPEQALCRPLFGSSWP